MSQSDRTATPVEAAFAAGGPPLLFVEQDAERLSQPHPIRRAEPRSHRTDRPTKETP